MSFVGVTKNVGKPQNSKVHYLLAIHDFDFIFSFFERLIMIALDK
jgi:hypothetical protein